MADRKCAQIIATAFCYRSKHDFQLGKEDACEFSGHLCLLADAGYQGLTELHENSQTPFKKSKYHALTKREKQSNRSLAGLRIVIEHIFRKLKVFRNPIISFMEINHTDETKQMSRAGYEALPLKLDRSANGQLIAVYKSLDGQQVWGPIEIID